MSDAIFGGPLFRTISNGKSPSFAVNFMIKDIEFLVDVLVQDLEIDHLFSPVSYYAVTHKVGSLSGRPSSSNLFNKVL